MLAYPIAFLPFQGGRYCGPLCFTPTAVGVATVVGELLMLSLLAVGISIAFRLESIGTGRTAVRWLVSPPRSASVVLLGLFSTFIAFLTLDAMSLYEAIWKPVVVPISFPLFFPVWVLYAITFPLSLLVSAAGIDPSPSLTLVTRGIVVGIGFPLSVVFQTFTVSALVSDIASGGESPADG